jgi:hypothetical protein
VEGFGRLGEVRLAVWPERSLESGVEDVGDLRGGLVGDGPHGGDDVPVAEELHGDGQVDRFVEVTVGGGGLAGGQECQVPVAGGLGG